MLIDFFGEPVLLATRRHVDPPDFLIAETSPPPAE
jgi:hypothetical protein